MEYFNSVPDYRVQGRSKYPLSTIIAIVAIATIAGCHGWKQIYEYATTYLYWFQTILPNITKLPSIDTLSRTMSNLDPKVFYELLPQLASDFLRLNNLGRRPKTGFSK
jgi:hypothetical protein